MMRFRMITFDATGTLIKVRNSVGYHYARITEQYGITPDEKLLNDNFRTAFKKQRASHPNFGKGNITPKQWWGGVLKETFQLAECPLDQKRFVEINDTVYEYSKTAQMWEVYPEVKEVLTSLNKSGVCLGVLSDNDERLIEMFRNLDLASHFAFLLPSVYADSGKSGGCLFRLALGRLQLPASDAVHVGDSYDDDYKSAQKVGVHPILIDRDETLRQEYPHLGKDNLITDLTELQRIISMS